MASVPIAIVTHWMGGNLGCKLGEKVRAQVVYHYRASYMLWL